MSEEAIMAAFRQFVPFGGADNTVAACRRYVAEAEAADAPEWEPIRVGDRVYELGHLRRFIASVDAGCSSRPGAD